MKKLKDKTVLITGGSSGIGLATARLFREEGARLIITGRDAETLKHAQEILGHDTQVIRSDAGSLDDIEALLNKVRERFGGLDVLFLNAAVAKPAPIEQVTETQFDEMMSINLKGVFFMIQKALPLFRENASIIVTTSIANRKASPQFSVYGASKAALRALVQSLSPALIGRGIRLNAISPGPIDTPMFDRFGLPAEMAEAKKREIEHKSPIRRFGSPDEIARTALFLACDDSSYIVGEEIVVDGGMSQI